MINPNLNEVHHEENNNSINYAETRPKVNEIIEQYSINRVLTYFDGLHEMRIECVFVERFSFTNNRKYRNILIYDVPSINKKLLIRFSIRTKKTNANKIIDEGHLMSEDVIWRDINDVIAIKGYNPNDILFCTQAKIESLDPNYNNLEYISDIYSYNYLNARMAESEMSVYTWGYILQDPDAEGVNRRVSKEVKKQLKKYITLIIHYI